MTLGEKLLQARQAKGLSQRQAAGAYMTRNMLSQLEHDQATPSIKTLTYLAGVLDVSVAWLIGEADTPPGQGAADQARRAFADSNWKACMEILEDKPEALTAEEQLLLCRAYLHGADEALHNRDLFSAERYAALAGEMDGLYLDSRDRLEARFLLARCALEQGKADAEAIHTLRKVCAETGTNEQLHRIFARYALQNNDLEAAEREVWQLSGTGFEDLLLRGELALQKQQLERALEYLQSAQSLGSESKLLQARLFRNLEQVYKSMDDFKMAYQYAVLRMEL